MNEKNNYNRLEFEKNFHNERFASGNRDRAGISKYYSINKVAKNTFYKLIENNCKNKKLIEYGCADGLNLEVYHDYGAILTGVDISEQGIKKAIESLKLKNINADCRVMNVEETNFDSNTFDIATGMGIIHHLDIKKVFEETSRILSENGQAIFFEPLGHNPLFNLFRKMTPNIRTIDEHPLLRKDLILLNNYFENVNITYFSLLTLFAVPLRNTFVFNLFYKFLSFLDKLIFNVPYIKDWAWVVIIHARNPIKTKSPS